MSSDSVSAKFTRLISKDELVASSETRLWHAQSEAVGVGTEANVSGDSPRPSQTQGRALRCAPGRRGFVSKVV